MASLALRKNVAISRPHSLPCERPLALLRKSERDSSGPKPRQPEIQHIPGAPSADTERLCGTRYAVAVEWRNAIHELGGPGGGSGRPAVPRQCEPAGPVTGQLTAAGGGAGMPGRNPGQSRLRAPAILRSPQSAVCTLRG